MKLTLVLTIAALCGMPLANAAYEELTFTEIITDEADNAGFHDLLAIAVAEPGDNTLVWRIDFAGATSAPLGGYNVFSFDGPDGTWYSMGFKQDGAPTHFGNAAALDPLSCVLEGNSGWCVIDYASIAAGVGSVLVETQGIAYVNHAAGSAASDQAPCPGGLLGPCIALQASGAGGYGESYTLTGCTKTGGCGPAGTGPVIFYQSVPTPTFDVTKSMVNPSSDTYVFNWTAKAATYDATFNATITGGSAMFTVVDSAGKTVFTGEASSTGLGTKQITNGAAGNWTATVKLTDFQGKFNLKIAEHVDEGGTSGSGSGSGSTSGSGTSGSGTGTSGSGSTSGGVTLGNDSESGKKTPIPVVVPLVALGIAALLLRRK